MTVQKYGPLHWDKTFRGGKKFMVLKRQYELMQDRKEINTH